MTHIAPRSAFDDFLAEQLADPEVRAGYEDAMAARSVIDRLVGFRRALRLKQAEVAKRMGVTQSTVSGFETENSDPRMSTIQRYARAVEARAEIRLTWEANCDWLVEESPYTRGEVHPITLARSHAKVKSAAWSAPYELVA